MDSGYYYYEGLFLPTDEMIKIFSTVSEDYPKYSVVPDHFHVTTKLLPKITHENMCGTEVSIHITGYTDGAATAPSDNSTSNNEGFTVELFSENPEMQKLPDSINKKHGFSAQESFRF